MRLLVTREDPNLRLELRDGSWWQELPAAESRWVHLGFCPSPVGVCRTVLHHICHGLMMGYRIRDVVRWSMKHRHWDGCPKDRPTQSKEVMPDETNDDGRDVPAVHSERAEDKA